MLCFAIWNAALPDDDSLEKAPLRDLIKEMVPEVWLLEMYKTWGSSQCQGQIIDTLDLFNGLLIPQGSMIEG